MRGHRAGLVEAPEMNAAAYQRAVTGYPSGRAGDHPALGGIGVNTGRVRPPAERGVHGGGRNPYGGAVVVDWVADELRVADDSRKPVGGRRSPR